MSKTEGKNTGRRVWRLSLAVCALLLIGGAAYRLTRPAEEIPTTPLPTVSVARPETGSIQVETSLIGQLTPGDVYYVTPKVAGEIREIYVSQGDMVEEGDPICRIDNQKQIDAAKISLDSAQVSVNTYQDSLNTAKANLDRMTALLNTGDISSQTYEQTKSAYDQAAAGLQGARLQLEAARLQYDTQVEYATVTAPVSGKVESESMEINAMASQSSQLCVITGDGAKKLVFSVTDRLLPALSVGDAIRVEKQGAEYEGTVTSIASMVDAATGLYPVEAVVTDNGAIPSGASVKVYFVSERTEDALLVPTDAVYYDGGKTYVYTFSSISQEELAQTEGGSTFTVMEGNQAGTVHKIEVETGLSDGENTEILSGLEADAPVILTWTSQLYEDAQVQALPETESGAAEAATEAAAEAETEGAAGGDAA